MMRNEKLQLNVIWNCISTYLDHQQREWRSDWLLAVALLRAALWRKEES
jgi:hypothetical protein